ncbi:hypothetical protein [Streptacidiphilus sp. P02-A3a]|uniref:hypothetical protein n=1 Tax=Streptacidiphilus sp. P02-A3a TaxID=2704468 RepID=UPI0015FAF68A|nr:hypothetical protein [Streptacidiphilus sp. P02-A3a]
MTQTFPTSDGGTVAVTRLSPTRFDLHLRAADGRTVATVVLTDAATRTMLDTLR